jgi:hypothetical protein
MLILIHILVALGGLMAAAAAWLRPSMAFIKVTASLTALTLLSGGALVVSHRAHLGPTCMSGLIYLAVVIPAAISAALRLPAGD